MASALRFFRFVLPLLHAVFVLTSMVNHDLPWSLLLATFLLVPFYALGFRVASSWLLVKLGHAAD